MTPTPTKKLKNPSKITWKIFIPLFLFILLFGCVDNTNKIGYTSKDFPIGSEVNSKQLLADKKECLFGRYFFIFTAKDPSICNNLEEKGYYNIKGTVVGYTYYENIPLSSYNYLLSNELIGGDGKEVVISSPIVDIREVEEADPIYMVLDEITWKKDINKEFDFICSEEITEKMIKDEILLLLPANNETTIKSKIETIAFGKEVILNTSYYLVIKINQIPNSFELNSYDNFVNTSKDIYECYSYYDKKGEGYYSCRIPEKVDYSEINGVLISIDNETYACSSYIEIG